MIKWWYPFAVIILVIVLTIYGILYIIQDMYQYLRIIYMFSIVLIKALLEILLEILFDHK